MRERTGQLYLDKKSGNWIARVGYYNTNGKRTAIQRRAANKTEARRLLSELLITVSRGGREAIEAERKTFNDIVDYYEERYAKPAVFVGNRKVEGMRNYKRVRGFLKVFRPYFGSKRLANITYGDVLEFRNMRLKIPTHYKRERDLATMNRELSCLRRIFNVAIREGWMSRNPVCSGESLIDLSAERRRDRILTIEEEARLLKACVAKRAYLRPFLMCLLDTGARKTETLLLRYEDLDFEKRLITYQALNTKTLKTRQIAMSQRVYSELSELWENSSKNSGEFIFKFMWVQKSFDSACREAGIETGRPFGITLHSLRHTAATRLINGNLPIQMVGRILSHQNPQTTYRYLTANDETLYRAALIFDSVQKE